MENHIDEAGLVAPVDEDGKPIEAPGIYDHAKVKAFVSCCIDLAKVNDLGLFEFLMASRNMLLAAEMQMAKRADEFNAEHPELSEDAAGSE